MKFTSLYAIAAGALIVASCSGKKETVDSIFEPFDYTLTVTNIDGADSTYAYLYDYDRMAGSRNNLSEAILDSTLIVGGEAKFAQKESTAGIVMLRINKKDFVIMPEDGDNTYDIATNTGSSKAAQALNDFLNDIQTIQKIASDNLPEENDPGYEAYVDSINALFATLNHDALANNLNNAFGLYYLTGIRQYTSNEELTLADMDSIIAMQPKFAKSKRVQAMIDDLKKFEATSANHPYVDFAIEYNGETKKLSDYVTPGEYTLVDFWATWCGPCKRAIAGLKEQYDTLKAEGLNIIGVGVWEDPETTVAWLNENPLPWPVILNAQSIPTDIYGIKGIPTLLLIGPDGNIVARSYSDEEILEAFHTAIAADKE
ncbi:MAG: TlpA family protein disulfide reductase [Bacteroidales bacterium]|nr:TlpA family protein disulfide reductase [Bacteroidales bacterium]